MYVSMMVRRTAEQAEATRRDLLQAALQVFGECGFSAATLGEIARRAGVTRGALYHHFTDKADVYDAVLREEAAQIMRPLTAELSGDGPPLERLRAFLVAYCTALEGDAAFRAVLEMLLFGDPSRSDESSSLTSQGYQFWQQAFRRLLEEAQQRGQLRAGVAVEQATNAVVTLAVGITATALQSPGLIAPAEAAESLVDALFGGIAA